jgi:ABC-type transporter lipoprotein component MlaA
MSGDDPPTTHSESVMRTTFGVLGLALLAAAVSLSPAAHTLGATAIEYGLIAAL